MSTPDRSGGQQEALRALTDRLRDDVAAAVHPEEVAALLEAEGLNDARVRERYGFPDAFALAEELFARVPRRHHPAPPPAAPAPGTDPVTCGLRGVLFALPALAYVLGSPLLDSEGRERWGMAAEVPVLLAGVLASWAWNQGVAHRAYVLLGLGDRDAAARALALGGWAGTALTCALVTALALANGQVRPGVWLFAVGQACYMAAATVLLVLGRERALLAALLPLVAGGAALAVVDLPLPLRAALVAASPAAVCALAVRLVASAVTRRAPGADRPRRRDSVPYGLLGLGTGLLVTQAVLGDVLRDGARGTVAAATALGLTLSMGPAEWLLARFRVRARTQLHRATSAAAFRSAVARELGLGLVAYLAALTLLVGACAAVWPRGPAPRGARLVHLLLLGVILWAILLLQSFGRPLPAAVVCGAAALAQLPGLYAAVLPLTAELAVPAVAAAVLPTAAWRHLSRVTAHR